MSLCNKIIQYVHAAPGSAARARQDVTGEDGKSCVLILMDFDLLSEFATRSTERKVPVVEAHVRKMIHGALIGRGAQKTGETEATRPAGQDVVVIHDGGRPLQQCAECAFKLSTSKGSAMDAESRIVTVVLNEDLEL